TNADRHRKRPPVYEVRARERAGDLHRARRNPPASEVLSGKALNDLLRSIKTNGNRGPNVALEEDTLAGINLAASASRGNVGMLKKDRLDWPLPLQNPRFDALRNRLSTRLAVAVVELKGNDLRASTIDDVNACHKALTEKLNSSVRELSPSQFIRA